jgi:uncharacterized membrane protein YgaE (UPF0421/DUF939 family)
VVTDTALLYRVVAATPKNDGAALTTGAIIGIAIGGGIAIILIALFIRCCKRQQQHTKNIDRLLDAGQYGATGDEYGKLPA